MAMVIKIFLTRSVGDDGIGLYMLVLPTFNLFITLCTLSLPISISKLISERNNSKRVILPIIPVSILYNFILMIILIISSSFIANKLLHNSLCYYPIMAISFTLPFICISSILKGYFYGKEKMIPFVISNIVEQIIRLIFIIFLIPRLIRYGISFTITFVVLINIISEFSSIIILILFMPKRKIMLSDFKIDNNIFKDILSISFSTTGSRLIGSVSYFLEPIILSFVLIRLGYSNSYVTSSYGVITGYVFPLLLIPSFFSVAISTSLLPVISSNLVRKRYVYAKNKLKQALGLSIFIGIIFTFVFMLFPGYLLKFIYNTKLGIKYIRIIAPFFLMHYIQGPLTSYMQGANMAKEAMFGTLFGAILKNVLLFILPIFFGIWGFIITSLVNIFFVTIHHIYYVRKSFVK